MIYKTLLRLFLGEYRSFGVLEVAQLADRVSVKEKRIVYFPIWVESGICKQIAEPADDGYWETRSDDAVL